MALKIITTITFTLIILIPSQLLQGWGFKAHVRINYDAIDTLPGGMKGFFDKEREFISEHAVDPDKWKSTDKLEFNRHFIDIDLYGTFPFKELPRNFDEAVTKFGTKMVLSNGALPWRIVEITQKLAEDMKEGDGEKIRMTAAALGHYVADAYSPLHSVENYNGQYTNNFGVHKQFESRMINRNMESYSPVLENATSIDKTLSQAFDIILDSYKLVLPILESETRARKELTIVQLDSLNNFKSKDIPVYLDILYSDLEEIGWEQMNNASIMLGRYWVTAWEIAGRPTLPK